METVLIVDDNELVRKLVRVHVQRAGYGVLEAASPADALDAARSCSTVDVVVSDLVMPDGGGIPLVQALKQIHPLLQALFMSGHEDPGTVDSFIAKPFTGGELIAALQRLFQVKHLSTAAAD